MMPWDFLALRAVFQQEGHRAKPHGAEDSAEDSVGREVLPQTSGQEVQSVLWHQERKDEGTPSPTLTFMV